MTYTFKLSRRLAVLILSVVLALVLAAIGFILASFSDITLHLIGDRFAALLRSRIVTKLFYLVIVGIGCAAGRMFPAQRGFQGSRDFLEHMFPGHSQVDYERADFFLSCVMGSVLGMLIVQPDGVHTALATGLAWPFIIRFLIEGMKTTRRPPKNPPQRRHTW